MISDTIKSLVPMRMIAEHYGFTVTRTGFISCPFHSEKTASLKIYPDGRGWYCYGCGKGGDVIDFVKALYGINFNQAIVRIDSDFRLNLPLGRKPSLRERREFAAEKRKREAELAEKERQGDELFEQYISALKRLSELNSWLKLYKPTSEDEDLHPLFVEALKNIEAAEFNLDCAEIERSKYERRFSNT